MVSMIALNINTLSDFPEDLIVAKMDIEAKLLEDGKIKDKQTFQDFVANLALQDSVFMSGKNAKSLEDTLIKRLEQIDNLIESNDANERNIDRLFDHIRFTFQKIGMVKYDAFHEMGGKLSFSLAMLNQKHLVYLMSLSFYHK